MVDPGGLVAALAEIALEAADIEAIDSAIRMQSSGMRLKRWGRYTKPTGTDFNAPTFTTRLLLRLDK
jgi:hypothetical protein